MVDPRAFTGPHHSDGTPDMDSAEWNAYCSGQWWAAVQEHQLVEGLAAAELPPLLELDVEDLVHLIRRHANGYRRCHPRGGQTMLVPLLQSLARLVDAAAARRADA